MTVYDYDLEFLEDGRTIELISIGIVADDGRELYLVNRDFRWKRLARRRWYAPWKWEIRQPWLVDNVVPSLPKLYGDARLHYASSSPLGLIDWQASEFRSYATIAKKVREFLLADGEPELWADYGAYDHVALCQLWGRMIDLPSGLPMFTRDIQQEAARLGVAWDQLPSQAEGNHNALADARHNVVKREYLRTVAARSNGTPS